MKKVAKYALYAGVSYLALNAAMGLGLIGFGPIGLTVKGLVKIAGAAVVTGMALKGSLHLAGRMLDKNNYPEYQYKAADGSKFTVDPVRQRVTRRLSRNFARAADFRSGLISDVVTKQYQGNPLRRIAERFYDHSLNFAFNKHLRVNTKSFEEAREYDEGATEIFVMEKYLKHAQEQYQKDQAAQQQKQTQQSTATQNKGNTQTQKPRNSAGPSA
jgi:hypothetical protein